MSGLPIDLQKLPPTALDVLRYLGTLEDGAWSDEIMDGAGLSERGFGKAIRRLVTRYYVAMPEQGYYTLTTNGLDAVQTLREIDGVAEPPAQDIDQDVEPEPEIVPESEPATDPASELTAPEPEPSAPPAPRAEPETAPETEIAWHQRRVSIFVPRGLVAQFASRLRFGFDRPDPHANPLLTIARTIVRMSAPGCAIDIPEYSIDVPAKGPAGPVDFRITPKRPGSVRVQIEVFQITDNDQSIPVGGMFFDLPIAEFPTPDSAEFQTLATTLRMYPGQRR